MENSREIRFALSRADSLNTFVESVELLYRPSYLIWCLFFLLQILVIQATQPIGAKISLIVSGSLVLLLAVLIQFRLFRRLLGLLFWSTFPEAEVQIVANDDGMTFETQRLDRPSDPIVRQVSWMELARRGVFEVLPEQLRVTLPIQRLGNENLPIAARRSQLDNPEAFDPFVRFCSAKLHDADRDLLGTPRFTFNFEARSDEVAQVPGGDSLGVLPVRIGAGVLMLIFAGQGLLSESWIGVVSKSLALGCLALLVAPSRSLWQLWHRIKYAPERWQIRVGEESILKSQRIRFAFPRFQTLSWRSLAETGSVTETDDLFLLQYPTRNGRRVSRTCWIPKRAFASRIEIDEFREFANAKMQGEQASRRPAFSV